MSKKHEEERLHEEDLPERILDSSDDSSPTPQFPLLLSPPDPINDERIVLPGAVAIVGIAGSSSVTSTSSDDSSQDGAEQVQSDSQIAQSTATHANGLLPELSARLVNEETEAEQARRIQQLEQQLQEAQRNLANEVRPPPQQPSPPAIITAEVVVLDVRAEEENERHRVEEATASNETGQRRWTARGKSHLLLVAAVSFVAGVVALVVFLSVRDSPSPPGPSSEILTMAPSMPSAAPTSDCTLLIGNLNWTVGSGVHAGSAFESGVIFAPIGLDPCRHRPSEVTMLYNGGDCAQSDNRQFLVFECADAAFGPPPTKEGARSYIVVMDASSKGVFYHIGWVAVGSPYNLRTPVGLEVLEQKQTISIYSSPETSVPSNLLQRATFDISCQSNLELANRFGASQLVGFVNDVQGSISMLPDYDIAMTIPIDTESKEFVRLENLTALTNFAGNLDLSDQVDGVVLEPQGGEVTITWPVSYFLEEPPPRNYTVLLQLTGRTMGGQACGRAAKHEVFQFA